MMKFFNRKAKPNLMDLHKYEHDCMRWKRKGITVMGPPMGYDNDEEARDIYEYYKNTNKPETPLATLDVMEHNARHTGKDE